MTPPPIALLLSLALLCACAIAAPSVTYVSVDGGNDEAACDAPETACKTIGAAYSKVDLADGTVRIAPGEYSGQGNWGMQLGTSSVVLLEATGSGVTVIVPTLSTGKSFIQSAWSDPKAPASGEIHLSGLNFVQKNSYNAADWVVDARAVRSLTIDACSFTGAGGNSIITMSGGNLAITRTSFTNCRVYSAIDVSHAATATFETCQFNDVSPQYSTIAAEYLDSISVINSSFSVSEYYGRSVTVGYTSSVELSGTVFDDNGDALYVYGSYDEKATSRVALTDVEAKNGGNIDLYHAVVTVTDSSIGGYVHIVNDCGGGSFARSNIFHLWLFCDEGDVVRVDSATAGTIKNIDIFDGVVQSDGALSPDFIAFSGDRAVVDAPSLQVSGTMRLGSHNSIVQGGEVSLGFSCHLEIEDSWNSDYSSYDIGRLLVGTARLDDVVVVLSGSAAYALMEHSLSDDQRIVLQCSEECKGRVEKARTDYGAKVKYDYNAKDLKILKVRDWNPYGDTTWADDLIAIAIALLGAAFFLALMYFSDKLRAKVQNYRRVEQV